MLDDLFNADKRTLSGEVKIASMRIKIKIALTKAELRDMLYSELNER